MKRKIYNDLLDWKNNTTSIKPLMVLGVRQSGKTYIIEEFCKSEFKKHIIVNLFERTDVVDLYNSSLTSDEKYNQLKALLNYDLDKKDSILFIDEIQQCENLISELKYFCEKHNNVRIICAGSLLGVSLKSTNASFPVGKVKMIDMYPMDFEEFLLAFKEEMLIETIRNCYEKNKSISESLHRKALNYYRTYLITGGMPESVKDMVLKSNDYFNYDKLILKDILSSYFNDMNKYVSNDAEALKINRIYNSLPSQLANASKKFQYSNISKNARARDFATALDWLKASRMVNCCRCVKNPEIPLEGFVDEDVFKLYLSDVGILNNILNLSIEDVLNDNISLYKGVIAENYVANQLLANNHNLYYWKSDATAEVDFLIYNKDGIIPIEVKASDNTKSKSLNIYSNEYSPKYSIRISTKEFGYNPTTKIKSIPLYAVFLIK